MNVAGDVLSARIEVFDKLTTSLGMRDKDKVPPAHPATLTDVFS